MEEQRPLWETLQDVNSPKWTLRMQAARELGFTHDDSAAPVLSEMLSDRTPSVREAAATALGKLGHSSATTGLYRCAIAEDEDKRVRASATCSLAIIAVLHDEAMTVFKQLLTDKDESVRLVAATAVSRLACDSDRSIELRVQTLSDSNAEIRAIAVRGLGSWDHIPILQERLLAALSDPSPDVRISAVESLGFCHHIPLVEDYLVSALRDQSEDVRKRAVESFGFCQSYEAASLLLQFVHDSDECIRANAVSAISPLSRDNDDVLRALLEALSDESFATRLAAAQGLSHSYREEALPRLREAVYDENAEVRANALFSICDIGGEKAIEIVTSLLDYLDAHLREIAVKRLESMKEDVRWQKEHQSQLDEEAHRRKMSEKEFAALLHQELSECPHCSYVGQWEVNIEPQIDVFVQPEQRYDKSALGETTFKVGLESRSAHIGVVSCPECGYVDEQFRDVTVFLDNDG